MRVQSTLATAATLATAVSAHPAARQTKCGPMKGDFHIKQYQLYPENADFDFNSCKLYVGYSLPKPHPHSNPRPSPTTNDNSPNTNFPSANSGTPPSASTTPTPAPTKP